MKKCPLDALTLVESDTSKKKKKIKNKKVYLQA
jgi:hypothetical protein